MAMRMSSRSSRVSASMPRDGSRSVGPGVTPSWWMAVSGVPDSVSPMGCGGAVAVWGVLVGIGFRLSVWAGQRSSSGLRGEVGCPGVWGPHSERHLGCVRALAVGWFGCRAALDSWVANRHWLRGKTGSRDGAPPDSAVSMGFDPSMAVRGTLGAAQRAGLGLRAYFGCAAVLGFPRVAVTPMKWCVASSRHPREVGAPQRGSAGLRSGFGCGASFGPGQRSRVGLRAHYGCPGSFSYATKSVGGSPITDGSSSATVATPADTISAATRSNHAIRACN